MKTLLHKILRLGVTGEQSPHRQRMVRTTNLMNLIALGIVLLSFTNLLVLGSDFALVPVLGIFSMAILSLWLNSVHHTKLSFLVFTFYINLSIFFFCEYHPFETQNYLYYFPVIVSVVLLNNPTFTDKFSLIHIAVCVAFFAATFLVNIPSMQLQLSSDKIIYLRNFNIICTAVITTILSILLTRLIARQNTEIVVQNLDLVKAKEIVNASLKEKEILLAELHHRVKNNLAIISGLLNLQDDATTNEEAKNIISDSKSRIMSMALVHKMLYENPELKSLDLGRYITELIHELFNSYNLGKYVRIKQDFDKIVLPVSKSIPLGLILNEIVTNSIKYVFRTRHKEKSEFFISIKQIDNEVAMIVKDDGAGFPQGFNAEAENPTLGIYLITTLCEQIDGKVNFSNDNGAKIQVNFSLQ